ncbi:AraC family transcriptional regulator [Rhizosphaericola mali]|uniref:AraC family transcriptional regulator n=1 Tax=Rhizosphaericola mali TaxID=2545455 RepID=A0A5P2G5P3_9BACT|nr:AraC family transcriptional regulator [Rhizosphaericola mali]QES89142.1 AraC family transcriptional regulator [Rhizosphaericola mali]
MKVLQFTIPVQEDKAIIARVDRLPFFYPYLHRHKETQITWVQQGEGTLMVNNQMHPFETNSLYFIGANQPHIFKSSPSYHNPKSTKSIVSLDIFFDPEIISKTLLNINELKPLQFFLKKIQTGFKIPQNLVPTISNKMLLINQSDDTILKTLYFIELLQDLKNIEDPELLSSERSIISTETDGIRISQIYNFILQNFDKDISLEDVAKKAFMTPQAFCRFFKKHTRHTFVSFLNEIRVNEACKLFLDGNYEGISTIAYKCGFNSITNFNRVFKSVTGKSPKLYKENLLKKMELNYA